jgi:3-oxoacyl-[acyl-carrier protein] reductase
MARFRHLLVTGASKGIGLRIVEYFLKSAGEPLDIVMVARASKDFEDTVHRLAIEHPKSQLRAVPADLSKEDDCLSVVRYVMDQAIPLQVLVNNAGYTNPTSFQDISVDDLRRTFDVNFIAPFVIIQELFRRGLHLRKIVNIASTAGMGPRPGWLSYAASKAALISMSDTLREELSIFGTDVVCVSPGRCATDLRKRLAPHEDPSTIMQPEQVAAAVYFLLSETGQYLDSHNIVIRQ